MFRALSPLACVLALMAGSARAQDWRVTWYLAHEFGRDQDGATTFIAPDGTGGVWTNATSGEASALCHITGGAPQPSELVVDVSTEPRPDREVAQPGLLFPRGSRGIVGAALWGEGKLAIGASSGLFWVDGPTLTYEPVVVPGRTFNKTMLAMSVHEPACDARGIQLLAEGGAGELWVWSPSLSLLRCVKARHGPCMWTHNTEPVPLEGVQARMDEWLAGQTPTAIAAGGPDETLIGTDKGDVLLVKHKAQVFGTSVTLTDRATSAKTGGSGPVWDLMRDSQGRIWVAYGGTPIALQERLGAIAMYDGAKWRAWDRDSSKLPARGFTAVCEIEPGVVWAGVDWADPKPGEVTSDQTGIIEFRNDTWAYIDPPGFHREPQSVVGVDPQYWPQAIGPELWRRVTMIRTDPTGRVWVGTHGGLACFER